ncbi:hypothetical protein BDY19DRAFT_941652, partial [Irpex rosettiformis]
TRARDSVALNRTALVFYGRWQLHWTLERVSYYNSSHTHTACANLRSWRVSTHSRH